MTKKLALFIPALMMLSPVGMAVAQEDLAGCTTMLESAVGHRLQAEGLDTSNACDLTVSQLAQIRVLLDDDGMGSRDRIQLILSEAE